MSHKPILATILLSLLASGVFLAQQERKAQDPNFQKNWWSIAFVDPSGASLDFVIANHTNADEFTYAASFNTGVLQEKSVRVPKGESRAVQLNFNKNDTSERVTVQVWQKDREMKELYK